MRVQRLIGSHRRGASAPRLVCLGTAAMLAAEAPKPHVIVDPHYGDTLFQFFQDRYFTAITGLMTSQHFNRVAQHADEAELLRGGMLLSYGMHKEAGEVFAQLIDKGATPPVRDRAWFYLAKIRYQRGFIEQAEDAMIRIENHLPPDMQEERALLQAQLLMARGDYAAAANVLETLTKTTGAGLYARYNLGVALVRAGEVARGMALLDDVGKAPAPTEEFKALRDKANVALGFAALTDEKPEAARAYLERVRLSSMLSNKALLGFGWASAALKQPKQALVPWTELTGSRDASDAAVLEARIAVAFAYAELGAYGQSLERYQEAIGAFDRENVALDESIGAIRAGKLLDGLLEKNPGDEMGWFWNIQELPELPHAGHLTQVLARHEFQEAFKNWRDLRFLTKNLQGWADALGGLQGHAGQSPPGLRRAAAQGARAGGTGAAGHRGDDQAARRIDRRGRQGRRRRRPHRAGRCRAARAARPRGRHARDPRALGQRPGDRCRRRPRAPRRRSLDVAARRRSIPIACGTRARRCARSTPSSNWRVRATRRWPKRNVTSPPGRSSSPRASPSSKPACAA